jgi:hypothetical protein
MADVVVNFQGIFAWVVPGVVVAQALLNELVKLSGVLLPQVYSRCMADSNL